MARGWMTGCTLTFCVRTPTGGYHRAFPALKDPQVAYGLQGGNRAATIDPAPVYGTLSSLGTEHELTLP